MAENGDSTNNQGAPPSSLASGSWDQKKEDGHEGVEVTTEGPAAAAALPQPPLVEPELVEPSPEQVVKSNDPVGNGHKLNINMTSANTTPHSAISSSHKQAEQEKDAPYRYKAGHRPEEEAWFLSRLFFIWARPLFRRAAYLVSEEGGAGGLQHDDLLPLPIEDHGHTVGGAFETAFRKSRAAQLESYRASGQAVPMAQKLSELKGNSSNKSTQNVRAAVGAVLGRRFWIAGMIKVVNTCLQFSFPLLLGAILEFIEDAQAGRIPDDAPWYDTYRGYWLSAVLFAAMAAKAITENVYFHRVYRAGYQSRVAVSVAVYNKSLRLANAERQDTTLGELINLMQVDATKIEMFVPQIHVLWVRTTNKCCLLCCVAWMLYVFVNYVSRMNSCDIHRLFLHARNTLTFPTPIHRFFIPNFSKTIHNRLQTTGRTLANHRIYGHSLHPHWMALLCRYGSHDCRRARPRYHYGKIVWRESQNV